MDLKEEAREFALKAMEPELTKVEEAYIAGYEAGKKAGWYPVDIDENGIEWVDLSLPSGTLWSKPIWRDKKHLLKLPYNMAKDMDIPTIEDWEELRHETKVSTKTYSNGTFWHTSILSQDGVEYIHNSDFWLKGEPDEKKKVLSIDDKAMKIYKFIGEQLHVVLVKHKK